MISAMVTSSAGPTALITSSRVRRLISPSQAELPPPVVSRRRAGCRALAARGKSRRKLVQQPEFDCRKYRDSDADHHVDPHRGTSLEAQYPGRYQCPQSDDQVQPFFPDGEGRKRRDREYGDGDTGDIGVFSSGSGEAEHPGRKEQDCAEDQICDVAQFCVRPILHDTLHREFPCTSQTKSCPNRFPPGLKKV